MAAAAGPRQQPSPLDETTNEARNVQHLPGKVLRRTQSSRALYRQLDSSESVPSFHESIWDAEVVRSDENRVENDLRSPGISPPPATLPQADFVLGVLPEELLDQVSELPPRTHVQDPVPSSNLPSQTAPSTMFRPTQLEPIVEQRSLASLHSSLCRTRVGQSPARDVTIVHQQQSHHSLQPSRQQNRPRTKTSASPPHRRRAFSLDDLECFSLSSLGCRVKRSRLFKSSSSEPCSFAPVDEKYSQVAEPQRAFHPPPQRAATPPGVPSFGSPEAVSYFDRPQPRSCSWWRTAVSITRGPSPVDTPVAQRTARSFDSSLPQPERPVRCVRGFGLLFHHVGQRSTSQARRASLPAGALRAEDGTLVRGRFGGRISGHGISSRGLQGHPMQRNGAAAHERKSNGDTDGFLVSRQRGRAQGQDRSVMSGVCGPDGVLRRTASTVSLPTTWPSGEDQPSPRYRVQPREQESGLMTVAAGRHQSPCQADAAYPPRSVSDPARPSTETCSTPITTSPSGSRFWHCWRWVCICCCGMTEKELEGCGWYGADRPWLRESRESIRLRRRQSRERRQRNASWDGQGEPRTEGGLRTSMRYRAGGSQGEG